MNLESSNVKLTQCFNMRELDMQKTKDRTWHAKAHAPARQGSCASAPGVLLPVLPINTPFRLVSFSPISIHSFHLLSSF